MEEFESDSDEAIEAVSDAKFLNTYKIMIEKWEMIYNVKSQLVAKNSELNEDNLKLSRQVEILVVGRRSPGKGGLCYVEQKEKVVVESPTVFVKVADGYHGGRLTRSTVTNVNVSWRDKVLGKGVEGFRDASNLVDSEEIKEIEFLEGKTLVIKLLEQSIGYAALHNRVYVLWRPTIPFQLIDIENDKLPGLPGHLYNRKILEEFGGLIGRMVKLDYNIASKIMGLFARMDIYINFNKPFMSQSQNKGKEPVVDFEATMANTTATPMVFRPLMQVKRKKHRNLRDSHNIKLKNHRKETLGLRFSVLHGLVDGDEKNEKNMSDISNKNFVNLRQVN
ncbi:hypothetical protein Goshw_017706 [Gossypium schwendimanii]|uniref:Uncharacterized protein n=1 Tax=Gossypium schwendimanii TaxID=34291 RepID=A0A7J9LNM6_GOSSC|nr:hypothetical protein [Gossypium schwendimanii]